jgi:DNA repair protein RadD
MKLNEGRHYQLAAVKNIRHAIRPIDHGGLGHQVVCFQGPTAMGKTWIFSYITYHADLRGNVTWILVHRKELLKQAHASMDELGVHHGMISPIFTPNPFAPTQIASIGTLVNRYTKLLPPKIIICDEFHHCVSPTWFKVLKYFIDRGTIVLGFTATPNRLDGRGLGKDCGGIADYLISGPQPRELIKQGFLAEPMIYRATLADSEGLHKKFGEFKQDEREAKLDRPQVIGDAVSQYKKICPNSPTIAFVPSLKVAERTMLEYQSAGFQAAMIEGKMSDRERDQRLKALGTGGLHVLVSCSLIDEGVDVPVVEGIQLLDFTMSVARFLQRTGRGARMFPGKKRYYLLDHCCNTFYPNMEINHGDPSWDREWSLDGEVKKAKAPAEEAVSYVQCPSCYRVHHKAPVCLYCGYVYAVNSRQFEQVDGELEALDAERLQAFDEARRKGEFKRQARDCITLQDWQDLAKQEGHKSGWAWHMFNIKHKRSTPAPELGF